MSVLAHLVPGWRPEDAAARALAYILDPHASPGMAEVVVDLLGRTGVPGFPVGRVEHDPAQTDDSRPDVTICDAGGKKRVLIETTFWAGVQDGQPAAYLGELPGDAASTLVFVAPRERIPGLWGELRARCRNLQGTKLGDEATKDGALAWARVDGHVLAVASWTYMLDALRRGAEDPAVEQDIVQLKGLANRMEEEAFLPLSASELGDVGLARRLVGYCALIAKISDRLVREGVARRKPRSWDEGSYKTGRIANTSMVVHETFDLRFGVEVRAWRDSGLTPLWWVLASSDTYRTTGHWQRIKDRLDGVRSYGDALYIPVRLKTGVEEAQVIDDAVGQMRQVAESLREASRRQ